MINRSLVQCRSCSYTLWLRIDRPETGNDQYLYSCPNCQLDTTLMVKNETHSVLIQSDECKEIEPKEVHLKDMDSNNVVTLSSFYPVFLDVHNKPLMEGGSPRLYFFTKYFDCAQRYIRVITFFSGIKCNFLHEHLNIISAIEDFNWKKVRGLLDKSKIKITNDIASMSEQLLINEAYSYTSILFFDLLGIEKRACLYDEYYKALNECNANHTSSYYSLLCDLHHEHQYLINRKKLFNIHRRIFKNVESYIAGFIYEFASDNFKQDMYRCRLYRSDFDTVKSLYVDIFELISKTSIYMILILNLANRGSIHKFSTPGISITKLKSMTSYNRLNLLAECPEIHSLFQSVSRKMRNDIGHFSAQYDVKTGVINYDSGQSEHYLIFLNNLLQAIKAFKIVYTVYSKVDLDFVQLRPNKNVL